MLEQVQVHDVEGSSECHDVWAGQFDVHDGRRDTLEEVRGEQMPAAENECSS